MASEAPRTGAPAHLATGDGRKLTSALRWLLRVFAGLALAAGVLLFVLSEETDTWFSWTIAPPLTAAFLGAAYWAACVLFVWSSSRGSFDLAAAALPPALVIAVLLLVATLIHHDRFHDDLFGWFWLTAYVVVPPAMMLLVAAQLREPGREPSGKAVRASPLPGWLRVILAVQAAAMIGVGIALFVAPADADSLWPWTLTPLTARALGAFLVGFGVAAAHACWDADVARFRGAALAYLTLGALELVAVARYWGDLGEIGLEAVVYLAFLASALALGIAGLVLTRSRAAGPTGGAS